MDTEEVMTSLTIRIVVVIPDDYEEAVKWFGNSTTLQEQLQSNAQQYVRSMCQMYNTERRRRDGSQA